MVGGLTTFMMMAYIVAVNPGMLSQALGQDLFGELLFATCASSAIATLIMAFGANYPFALAPGMGLNAMFTFTVVMGMGVRWDIALGVCLASGLIFTVLSLLQIREAIINGVPAPLKHATAAALVIVGVLMMSSVSRIDWEDLSDALPAFMALLVMPLTFSIANGVAAGIIIYPIVKRLSGRGGEVHPLIDVLAVLFIARYLFLA